MSLDWPDKTTHGMDSWAAGGERAGIWETRKPGQPERDYLEAVKKELASTFLPGVKIADSDVHRRATGSPQFWRTCWFCGSIHPGDLYDLLTGTPGVKMGGSDWKYGWPHKFYIDGIPNPDPTEWLCSSRAGGPCDVCRMPAPGEDFSTRFFQARIARPADPECVWCEGIGSNPSHLPKNEPSVFYNYPVLRAKFYSDHLPELNNDAFEALSDLIFERAQIRFSKTIEDKIRWTAPYHGYQA